MTQDRSSLQHLISKINNIQISYLNSMLYENSSTIFSIFTSMKQISKFIQFVSHSQSNFELQLLPRLSFASTLLGYQFYPTSVTMLPYQSLLFTLTCSKFNLIRVFISPCQDHNFTLKEFQFCPARFTIQP